MEPSEKHAVTLDKTISLLRKLEDCFQFEDNEKTQLQNITSAFDDILQGWNHLLSLASITTTTVANLGSNRQANISSPGRPSYNISAETLEELLQRPLGNHRQPILVCISSQQNFSVF